MKQSIKDKILSETSEETKQRVRETANKLIMKKETLKEAANEYSKKKYSIKYGYCDEDYYISFLSFIDGTKWQQERSYSEEEVRKAFEFYAERVICDIKYLDDDFTEFIKQFKKK
jgi:hypothetical protein